MTTMYAVEFYDDAPMSTVAMFAREDDARSWAVSRGRDSFIQRVEIEARAPYQPMSFARAFEHLEEAQNALELLYDRLTGLQKLSERSK